MKSKNEAERWFRWLRWVGVWMSCRESQMEPKVKPLIAFFPALCIAFAAFLSIRFCSTRMIVGLMRNQVWFSWWFWLTLLPHQLYSKTIQNVTCFFVLHRNSTILCWRQEFKWIFSPILSRKWTDYEDERQRKAIKENCARERDKKKWSVSECECE